MSQKQQEDSKKHIVLSFPKDLTDTPYIEKIILKSIDYIKAGLFIHLQGKPNTGKTTFARYIACLLQQPVVSLHSSFNNAQTIPLVEQAVTQGHTLIFDECQRASFDNWQQLLPLFEENLLHFPLVSIDGSELHHIHPRFVAIFTSNTDENMLWKIPETTLDNISVRVPLTEFDGQSEVAILCAKSNVNPLTAQVISTLLQKLRANDAYTGNTSIKLGIMLGRICHAQSIQVPTQTKQVRQIFEEILNIPSQPALLDIIRKTISETFEQLPPETESTPMIPESNDQQTPVPSPQNNDAKDITVMLHSEIELEMQFFDEIITFMQEISDETAEVSFHHPGDAVQPDILINISERFLPEIIHFIETQTKGEVALTRNQTKGFNECDVFIKIPVAPSTPKTEEAVPHVPVITDHQTSTNSKAFSRRQAPDEAQIRIQKLKKLIANYEKHHSSS